MNTPLLDQGGRVEKPRGCNESSPSKFPYMKPVNTPTCQAEGKIYLPLPQNVYFDSSNTSLKHYN